MLQSLETTKAGKSMKLVKVQHIPLKLEMVTKPIEMSLLPDKPNQWETVPRKKLVHILFSQFFDFTFFFLNLSDTKRCLNTWMNKV